MTSSTALPTSSSTASTTAPTMTATSGIDDFDLPKAVITRLVKASVPDGILLQKDARAALSRSTVVFISYLTATAMECARATGRKNMSMNDVYTALKELELDPMMDKIHDRMNAYLSSVNGKKDAAKLKRQQLRQQAKLKSSQQSENAGDEDGDDDESMRMERKRKASSDQEDV